MFWEPGRVGKTHCPWRARQERACQNARNPKLQTLTHLTHISKYIPLNSLLHALPAPWRLAYTVNHCVFIAFHLFFLSPQTLNFFFSSFFLFFIFTVFHYFSFTLFFHFLTISAIFIFSSFLFFFNFLDFLHFLQFLHFLFLFSFFLFPFFRYFPILLNVHCFFFLFRVLKI